MPYLNSVGSIATATPLNLDALYLNGIRTIDEMVELEEYIDAAEAGLLQPLPSTVRLCEQMKDYVRANPMLLDEPWVRAGGAVYDMIEAVREERLAAETVDIICLVPSKKR